MKVLAIGNSFSQDATRYLHQIAAADGEDITVVNLCIGGCSLETHYKNIIEDLPAYTYQLNGQTLEGTISVKEGLLSDDWDVVTMQQVSYKSVDYSTFQPYLNELSEYVNKYAPKAKQILQQTWAYEENSERLTIELGYRTGSEMFSDIKTAYKKASQALGGIPVIPSGRAFDIAAKHGFSYLHRDSFHASYGFGRYMIALVWYKMLTGRSVLDNTFHDFDEEISVKDMDFAKKIASAAVYEYTGILDVPYTQQEECKLDIHLPNKEHFPVFVYFHGGGLERGDKKDASLALSEIVENGCGVVSANYRMYPTAKYPEFIEDAAAAVAYVKENIAKYGGEQIFVGGSSAGAYLSMMLYFDKKYLGEYQIDPDQLGGFLFDGGQPTTHFNVLKEKGMDVRSVVIDEMSPIYHICEREDSAAITILVADNDMPGRLEQTHVLYHTLLHFGYPEHKVRMKVMKGFGHCEYNHVPDENGQSIFAREIYELIRRST